MTLDELLAKQEITDLVGTYMRGLDRLDRELLRSTFHDDATTDYLSISFSAVDAVNHFFGVASFENEDVLIQLDRRLAELFEFVDNEIGLEHVLIVLSADHGMPEMPEYVTELGRGGEDYLAVQARRALSGRYAAHAEVRPSVADPDALLGWVVFSGKGLARRRDEIVTTTAELLSGTRYDEHERLRELLQQSRAEAEQGITDHGHQLAVLTAARGLTPSATASCARVAEATS